MRPAVRADQPAVPQSPARGHEHELEPEFGLPEALPADERILWQGQPQAALVARRIFHLPALALYFGVMLAWRVAVQVHDGAAWHEALRGTVALALLAAVALTIVATLARLTASTTAYTLTNKRVVMRIGIVRATSSAAHDSCQRSRRWSRWSVGPKGITAKRQSAGTSAMMGARR